MSELTYEDFKQRINIQEVLQDAGYHLNRKDGIRYPSYVRLDSNGRRIRGDKFIAASNRPNSGTTTSSPLSRSIRISLRNIRRGCRRTGW